MLYHSFQQKFHFENYNLYIYETNFDEIRDKASLISEPLCLIDDINSKHFKLLIENEMIGGWSLFFESNNRMRFKHFFIFKQYRGVKIDNNQTFARFILDWSQLFFKNYYQVFCCHIHQDNKLSLKLASNIGLKPIRTDYEEWVYHEKENAYYRN